MKSSTMKYTQRLKLSITADMIFIATLVVSALLIVKEKITMNNLGLIIAVFLIVGGACLATALYKERGECRKWRNIWKLPIWQIQFSGTIKSTVKIIYFHSKLAKI